MQVTIIRQFPFVLFLSNSFLKQTPLDWDSIFSGGSPPYFGKKKIINKEKMQKEEKPAGQAIFANQFCFNI